MQAEKKALLTPVKDSSVRQPKDHSRGVKCYLVWKAQHRDQRQSSFGNTDTVTALYVHLSGPRKEWINDLAWKSCLHLTLLHHTWRLRKFDGKGIRVTSSEVQAPSCWCCPRSQLPKRSNFHLRWSSTYQCWAQVTQPRHSLNIFSTATGLTWHPE